MWVTSFVLLWSEAGVGRSANVGSCQKTMLFESWGSSAGIGHAFACFAHERPAHEMIFFSAHSVDC